MKTKVEPCPKCKSTDLEISDCGYSAFNIAWVRCKNCNLEAKTLGDNATSEWNKWAKDPIGALTNQVLESLERKKKFSRRKTVDVSEYAVDLILEMFKKHDKKRN